MDGGCDRLVARVQRHLRSIGSDDAFETVLPSDVEELEARAQRLRGLDDRFIHVGLSRFIAEGSATSLSGRVGGVCVATEA